MHSCSMCAVLIRYAHPIPVILCTYTAVFNKAVPYYRLLDLSFANISVLSQRDIYLIPNCRGVKMYPNDDAFTLQ